MKRLFTKTILLFFTLSFYNEFKAQCTIVAGCVPSTVAATPYCTTPVQLASLPNATLNTPYTTTIQLSVGGSSVVNSVLFNSTGSGSISTIALPAGLSITSNPIGSSIIGGQSGCIVISGTPTVSGNFTITATAADYVTSVTPLGGPYFFKWNLQIQGPVAIEEFNYQNINFEIFPNPANSSVKIKSTQRETIVTITDALGKIILSEFGSIEIGIDLSNFNQGIYFVRLESKGIYRVKKLIVNK